MRTTPTFDLAVIGAGPLGTATARHAAESGARVLLIGPDEPAGTESHEGTWAGYYDQGRLCHVLEVPLATSLLTMRSRRRFADLIARTGIDFLTPTHSVTVLPDGEGAASSLWFDREVLARNAADLGVAVDHLDAQQLAAAYPTLSFPPDHVALREPDAFLLNPRALVQAELSAALAAGAVLVRDEVVATAEVAEGIQVTARGGESWTAARVVVATGAATNATGLLARRLQTTTYGATVVLAEVAGPDAVAMPTMMMMKVRDGAMAFGGIVMAPVQYPDGRWYIKTSGASLLANPLTERDEIAAWVRTGGRAADIDEARELLGELLPDVEILSMRTRPCLVCDTPSDRPYIDWADDRTVVLVEGERGAMAADEIGRLGAELALTGEWRDSIPHEVFAAAWAEGDAAPIDEQYGERPAGAASFVPVVPAGQEETYAAWHLAPAVRAGDTIHCSGVLGTRPDGSVPDDLAEEIDLALTNLAHVLDAAGASLADVVDLLTFHLDLAAQVPTFMQVRDRRLSEPWPAWTAIGATQIGGGLPGVRLEIKATARVLPA
ncbi:FAD-dependent oxidoreductase [Nocardioides pacificus]